MGCCISRIEREEMVSRCKARKRYMKQLVKARQAFAASHSMYVRALRASGSALFQFATNESNLPRPDPHHRPLRPPTPPPPLPPPMSPTSDTWTTSTTASTALPPPPPPPHLQSSTWDFWDPFVPASSSMSPVDEDPWDATTNTASDLPVRPTVPGAASVTAPPSVVSGFSKDTGRTSSSTELAMVVSTKSKELVEIIKELDDYFLRAADAGGHLSFLLEVPNRAFSDQPHTSKIYGNGKSLSPMLWGWGMSPKFSEFKGNGNIVCGGGDGGGEGNGRHCSTIERLYAWEKKLYLEVKNAETLKVEHEKKAAQLRKLEIKRADYVRTEKAKEEVEKLESRMMVASQAIGTTSDEIIKLRESELYPQLVDLVKGLVEMWRSLYECHQVQTHIVEQLKYLSHIPSSDPTSEIHRQSTLQLELELQQWHMSFCNLVKAQRDYIQSLTGWLRLSLFQFGTNPISKNSQDSAIYSLCEKWQLAVNNAPDKVASEGINSFLTGINAIVMQQTEELKQKKRSESVFKELEKKAVKLRWLECKYGPYSMPGDSGRTMGKNPVANKQAKVEVLRSKAEDERAKYEKSSSVTRAMTINNLQIGLPHVFQAVTGYANVCAHAFESVYNQAKGIDEVNEVKRILP